MQRLKFKMIFPAVSALMALTLTSAAHAGGLFDLSAGIHRIQAELANTNASRALGLMNRKSLPGNRGMLFVFPDASAHCMWMRNTLIPLSVAFLDEQGQIINVEEMLPQTEDQHCAKRPAKFALEMSAGWFKSHGFDAGTPIKGVDKVPAGI